MAAQFESDLASDYSNDDIRPESVMDIDPELGALTSTTHETRGLQNLTFDLDSDDFFEPLVFSDDEDGDEDFVSENEGEDGEFDLREHLKMASGFRVKKKPTSKHYGKRQAMRAAAKEMDPEAASYFTQANQLFVENKLDEAMHYYQQVVKIEPKQAKAYKTMGEICQQKGQMSKCCSYWFMAAELSLWDLELWDTVAELSAELGFVDQAIFCYTHLINYKSGNRGPDPRFIMERSMLYKQKGQYGRALEGLQRMHQLLPTDASIIKDLAAVYVEQRRVTDAVNLYMRVLDVNMKSDEPPVLEPQFGWSELNILCELFLIQHSWRMGLKIIKTVARWLSNRQDETWWDDQDDDSEFDSRRRQVIHKKRPTDYQNFMNRDSSMPIDLRFKLGTFRLELGQKEEALTHYRALFSQGDKYDLKDLFFTAGRNLEEHGYFKDALEFLEEVTKMEDSTEANILRGRCYMEIFEYEKGKKVLLDVLIRNPDDLDLKLLLSETYLHTDDTENARKLILEVEEKKSLMKADAAEEELDLELSEEDNLAIIKNSSSAKTARGGKPSDEEKNEAEVHATRLVVSKFRRMQRILSSLDKSGKVGAASWLKLADQLIETFTSVRSFFPKNRKTTFKGIPTYRRKQSLAIEDQLSRLKHLAEDMAVGDTSRLEMTSKTSFRGLDYDQWLSVFIQYAFLLRYFKKDYSGAVSVLEEAMTGSVFSQDKTRSMLLRLSLLIFGILREDFTEAVSNNVRYLLTSTQFSPTIYDFFMCCFSSGVGAWAAFSNYNHQKYFLRQLKAYDSLLTSSKISGSAHVTIDTNNFSFTREHPQLLYIYACLLGSNRTFSSPIVYLTRAYRQYNQDPTICFMLGLAHVHRSMQRNSNNRHLQLLQGISYLLEYKEARELGATTYERQEIEYNFGRLFHMLGLTSLAVNHYNKVLEFHEELQDDPTYDMLVEAAYNLSLIYTIDGNTELSRQITEQYLTI